jgi:hypothetical protein
LDNDKRGIIFLSHHQNFSAFRDDDHTTPPKQLSSLFGPERTILWFWGHEHRFAVYGCNQLPNGSKLFARCIGNSERKIIDKDIRLGHNGYAILKLKDNNLAIEYYDDNNNNQERIQRLILSENWLLDNETGKLEGVAIKNFTESTDTRLTLFADNINKAIDAT